MTGAERLRAAAAALRGAIDSVPGGPWVLTKFGGDQLALQSLHPDAEGWSSIVCDGDDWSDQWARLAGYAVYLNPDVAGFLAQLLDWAAEHHPADSRWLATAGAILAADDAGWEARRG